MIIYLLVASRYVKLSVIAMLDIKICDKRMVIPREKPEVGDEARTVPPDTGNSTQREVVGAQASIVLD